MFLEKERVTFLQKLKRAILTIPPEKAFYAGFFMTLSIIFALLSIAFYVRSLSVEVPKYNSELNIGMLGEVRYITPTYSSLENEDIVSGLLYAGLLKKDNDGKFVNDLAEAVEKNPDLTQIKVKIKDDAEFSDGTDLTSNDVVFTYRMLSDSQVRSNKKVRFEGLEFEVIDNKNFIINLKTPYLFIEEVLTTGILSSREYENIAFENILTSSLNQGSTESGSYQIKEKVTDENGKIRTLKLVSNANYVNKRPYIKYVNIKFYNTTSELIKEYNNKNLDLVFDLTEKDLELITETKYYKHNYTLPRIVAIFLNANKNESFAKKEIREQIYKSLDRGNFSNFGVETYGLTPESKFSFEPITDTSTSTINLTSQDSIQTTEIASIIKNSLAGKGININLDLKNVNDLNQTIIRNREYEALLSTIEIQSPMDLYAFWHSSQRNAPGLNLSSYTSKTFDSNLEKLKTSTSSESVTVHLGEIEEEFYKEYPYIPIYSPSKLVIYKPTLEANITKNIITGKDLIKDISSWHTETELVLPLFHNQNFIDRLYKIIH